MLLPTAVDGRDRPAQVKESFRQLPWGVVAPLRQTVQESGATAKLCMREPKNVYACDKGHYHINDVARG